MLQNAPVLRNAPVNLANLTAIIEGVSHLLHRVIILLDKAGSKLSRNRIL